MGIIKTAIVIFLTFFGIDKMNATGALRETFLQMASLFKHKVTVSKLEETDLAVNPDIKSFVELNGLFNFLLIRAMGIHENSDLPPNTKQAYENIAEFYHRLPPSGKTIFDRLENVSYNIRQAKSPAEIIQPAEELFKLLDETGFNNGVGAHLINKLNKFYPLQKIPCTYYLSGMFPNMGKVLDKEFDDLHAKMISKEGFVSDYAYMFALCARGYTTNKMTQIYEILTSLSHDNLVRLWRLGRDIIKLHNEKQWNSNSLHDFFRELSYLSGRKCSNLLLDISEIPQEPVQTKEEEEVITPLRGLVSNLNWWQQFIAAELMCLPPKTILDILPGPGMVNMELLEKFYPASGLRKLNRFLVQELGDSPSSSRGSPTPRPRRRLPHAGSVPWTCPHCHALWSQLDYCLHQQAEFYTYPSYYNELYHY